MFNRQKTQVEASPAGSRAQGQKEREKLPNLTSPQGSANHSQARRLLHTGSDSRTHTAESVRVWKDQSPAGQEPAGVQPLREVALTESHPKPAAPTSPPCVGVRAGPPQNRV